MDSDRIGVRHVDRLPPSDRIIGNDTWLLTPLKKSRAGWQEEMMGSSALCMVTAAASPRNDVRWSGGD